MNQGPDPASFQAMSDEQLDKIERDMRSKRGKGGLSAGAMDQPLSMIGAERKRRKKAAHEEKIQGLEKEREETIQLLTARPGRRATEFAGGGGGQNPFRL
jgi:hypothetical protein